VRHTGVVISTPPRIAVAVEPAMLADSLIRVLETIGVDVVIDLREVDSVTAAHFDAAITTGDLPANIETDLVIRLPETGSGTTAGWVQRGVGRFAVDIPDLEAALELLNAFCPAGGPRRAP
jgi:hypothetical protein